MEYGDGHRRVGHATVGQLGGDDETVGVHAQMQLGPAAPFVRRPVLENLPFAVADPLEAGPSVDQVARSVSEYSDSLLAPSG